MVLDLNARRQYGKGRYPPHFFGGARGDRTGKKDRGAWSRAWLARGCREMSITRMTVEESFRAVLVANLRFCACFRLFFTVT